MALPATDNFNRDNTSPIGGNWTRIHAMDSIRVVDNAVMGITSTARNGAYWNADTFSNDQYSSIKLGNIDTDNPAPAPACRVKSNEQSFYNVVTDKSVVRFRKIIAATLTTIGSDIPYTVANGDILKLSVVGTELEAFVNGVSVGTVTDSSIASGSAGIFIFGNLTPIADDWEGGNMETGGGQPTIKRFGGIPFCSPNQGVW